MDHPNVALFRQLTAAMMSGDAEGAKDLLAENLRWHEAGNPDVIEGRDAVLDRMQGMRQLLELGTIDTHEVLANDEHIVALSKVSLRHPDGSTLSYSAVDVAHVDGGVVTERWAFMDAVPADVQEFFARLG